MTDRPTAADRFRGAATKRALGLTSVRTTEQPVEETATDSAHASGESTAPTAPPPVRSTVIDPVTADIFRAAPDLDPAPDVPEPAEKPSSGRPKRTAKKSPATGGRTRLPVYVPGALYNRLAARIATTGETYTAVVLDAISEHHSTLQTRYQARSGPGLFVGSGRRRRTGKATTQIQLLLLPQDRETLTRLIAESGADNPSVYVSDALELHLGP